MQVFELKDPKIMGDEDPKYGFTFWSQTDTDLPVMFNSKQGNILPGTRIMAEKATEKTSKNGTDYLRLAGTKIEDTPGQVTAPFETKPKPTFEKAKDESKFLRDVTSVPLDVWRVLINVQGVPENGEQFARFFETVKEHADELLAMIDKVRGGQAGQPTLPVSVKEPRGVATTSLGDTFRQRDKEQKEAWKARNVEDGMTAGEPDLSDEDMRE